MSAVINRRSGVNSVAFIIGFRRAAITVSVITDLVIGTSDKTSVSSVINRRFRVGGVAFITSSWRATISAIAELSVGACCRSCTYFVYFFLQARQVGNADIVVPALFAMFHAYVFTVCFYKVMTGYADFNQSMFFAFEFDSIGTPRPINVGDQTGRNDDGPGTVDSNPDGFNVSGEVIGVAAFELHASVDHEWFRGVIEDIMATDVSLSYMPCIPDRVEV